VIDLPRNTQQLKRINLSAARSLEEGLEEPLTVHRSGVGALLRRKLATTNPIESHLSTVQRAGGAAVLDSYRTPRSREKVPTLQRVRRDPAAEGTTESVADSAERGPDSESRLTFKSTSRNFDGTEAEIMNTKDLEILKANIDKVIKIICRDGETLLAKVVLVSEDDQDVVYDLVSATRESQYEKVDKQPAYRITFQEIESVETVAPR
jgi:hypothetical protein